MRHQICTKCCIDTTVLGVKFNQSGECNFCKMHNELDQEFPLNQQGQKKFKIIIQKIIKAGRGRKYDCVVGISGGRDGCYTLYLAKKLGLRPLAIHFNDGFGNPVAGENMTNVTKKLGVDLKTVTSDWRESKDIRVAFLKASTPDLGMPNDLGIATALYSSALQENIKYVLVGHSFRTEGVAPVGWLYMEGRYLQDVHGRFGKIKLRKWQPLDPGFNLGLYQLAYYTIFKRIKTIFPLYMVNYVRDEVDDILSNELDWVYPGAHHLDDLYQSLMTYILRVKFNIDRRLLHYGALIRSSQMSREEALDRMKDVYVIEDPKVIDLCLKRLGLSQEEFDNILKIPKKTFLDYKTNLSTLKRFKYLIKLLTYVDIFPKSTYLKYFEY